MPKKRNPERKVKDKLPAPTECRFCKSKVELVENKAIYGENYGRWPYSYLCTKESCRAYVGCHPNTHIPLGTLADRPTREARKKAKTALDNLWRHYGYMSRGKAYKNLAKALKIPIEECHIGWFDIPMCERAVEICDDLYEQVTQGEKIK